MGMLYLLIISSLLFLGVLAWDIETDYIKWVGKKDILHQKEAWERIGLLTFPSVGICSFLFIRLYGLLKILPIHAFLLSALVSILLTICLLFFLYWLLFDGLYNIRRGFHFWYNGDSHGKTDDSLLDQFLRTIPDTTEGFIKLGGALIALSLYVTLCIT